MNSSNFCNINGNKSSIDADSAIVLLLGGAPTPPERVTRYLQTAPRLWAADGGAALALAAGHVPDAVIGDMDSLSAETIAALPTGVLHRVAEQDTTDFEKALRHIQAPLILALGFTGGRLDHELAVFNAIVRHRGAPVILIGDADIIFRAPRRMALDLPLDSRLSLFPMGQLSGRSRGLAWPIEGIDFAPDGRIGTSNRVTGPVDLQFDGDQMLIILPLAALNQVIARLCAAGTALAE